MMILFLESSSLPAVVLSMAKDVQTEQNQSQKSFFGTYDLILKSKS